ncbi:hypothetical protein AJ80_03263 [Polytolypa hystricis UAMH7299]|uniref:Protein BNI4 n=1 Tax=Polytolypa hystricis (strain UAMH7299) TaxID=1447883 RepID=A0A2B7YKV0_POLH7|nr:hypothetical protein AJ80_03263 [Polytolypa hystricis UAMH7299]
MAALVQTIPQQASTITLLQPRPSSSSSALTSPSHSSMQPNPQMARNQQSSRPAYNTVGSSGVYRPSQAAQPVAPYAFTSTPSLTAAGSHHIRQNTLPAYLKPETRTQSAPSVPQGQTSLTIAPSSRVHYPAAGSVSNSSTPINVSSTLSHGSKDDSALPARRRAGEPAARPTSVIGFTPPTLTIPSSPSSSMKPSPDRYRRGQRRTDQTQSPVSTSTSSPVSANVPNSAISGPTTSDPLLTLDFDKSSLLDLNKPPTIGHHSRVVSADDGKSTPKSQTPELAKRYRRRSVGSFDSAGLLKISGPNGSSLTLPNTSELQTRGNATPSNHSHSDSLESTSSTRSQSSSIKSDAVTSQHTVNNRPSSPNRAHESQKRSTTPSPLSRSLNVGSENGKAKDARTMPTEIPARGSSQQASAQAKPQSPAAKRLAELSNKQGKPKSRLRRALSFGSAAELRAASAPHTVEQPTTPSEPLTRKQQLDAELGAEQAAIAERQEANGLGENIYSGHLFSSSTDNLSISSTASSASIMLRKMGKGVKRSTRSLVGLFRPKSIHASSPDAIPPQAMVPQVSMVTVEAEREKGTNANGSARSNVTNGSIYRGSVEDDTSIRGVRQSSTDSVQTRKSIIGGERERAEVLAAVRKGILKKNSSSPIIRPADARGDLNGVPAHHLNDSPHSSVPSTPVDDHPRSGHRRTDSVTIEGEDYFLPGGRFTGGDNNSAPTSPRAGSVKNISFSPRIQFHDTWPPGEYDRRGEIATCNRLTPLLAQQIKEELNTFKMEMEVHESSKIYTHFF